MKIKVNNCVGCETCMSYCELRDNSYIWKCDECGEEDDDIYYFEGNELCTRCILKRLEKVN